MKIESEVMFKSIRYLYFCLIQLFLIMLFGSFSDDLSIKWVEPIKL